MDSIKNNMKIDNIEKDVDLIKKDQAIIGKHTTSAINGVNSKLSWIIAILIIDHIGILIAIIYFAGMVQHMSRSFY